MTHPELASTPGRLIGRIAGKVTGRVVETVQPDIILEHVDVDALVDRIDVNRLLARVDLEAVLRDIDLEELVGRSGIPDIVAESTSRVAGSALDLARRQLAGLDAVLDRVIAKILRRDSSARPTAPRLLGELEKA